MRKLIDHHRFSWSDTWYNPRGTHIPAETGVFVRRQVNCAGHDHLKRARTELMTTMLQRSQTRGWEERGWAAFHRLWNIGDRDDVGYGVPPKSEETLCVNISTAAPGDEDSTVDDDIELEFLSEEDIMDIDHDGEDFLEDGERSTTEQTVAQNAAEDAPSAAEMTGGDCRKEVLTLVANVRQNVQDRVFEDEAERESALEYLADIERQHGLS